MSLPPCFASPDQAGGALPLRLVDRAGFPAWLERQDAAIRDWLQGNGFGGQPGAPLLVPGSDG
ncbi:MAG TPA: leucyl aminopeptidase family protein, partial [Luteimonas sp.]|nr:leucyl aminopeptidase family protein [Luteimonas sp.]